MLFQRNIPTLEAKISNKPSSFARSKFTKTSVIQARSTTKRARIMSFLMILV